MQRPLWLCSIMVTSAEVRLTLLGSDRKLYSTFSPPWIFQGGWACVRVTLQRCSPSDPRVSLQPTLGFRGFHWEHTYTDREHQHTLFIFILILIILILIIIPINSIIIINIICILMVFILITAILIIHLLFIVFIDSQNCPAQPPGIWGVGGWTPVQAHCHSYYDSEWCHSQTQAASHEDSLLIHQAGQMEKPMVIHESLHFLCCPAGLRQLSPRFKSNYGAGFCCFHRRRFHLQRCLRFHPDRAERWCKSWEILLLHPLSRSKDGRKWMGVDQKEVRISGTVPQLQVQIPDTSWWWWWNGFSLSCRKKNLEPMWFYRMFLSINKG